MNDCYLLHHHIAHPVFSDTMFPSTVSRSGNKFAQLYVTDIGGVRVHPMTFRSEASETLLLLDTRDSVLPHAKKMIQGKYFQKLKDAACQMGQLEPYSPSSKTSMRETNEQKKGMS